MEKQPNAIRWLVHPETVALLLLCLTRAHKHANTACASSRWRFCCTLHTREHVIA